MIFSLEAAASAPNGFVASTGTGPANPYFGGIPIEIGSSGGDSTGTPVTLTLTPNPGLNNNPLIINFINGQPYDTNRPSVIGNLKIGDTFNYWLSMSGGGTQGGNMIMMLNVQDTVSASSTPEPGTWTLLLAGMFPAAIVLLVRASKNRAQKTSCC
jgi:hypothetical protein